VSAVASGSPSGSTPSVSVSPNRSGFVGFVGSLVVPVALRLSVTLGLPATAAENSSVVVETSSMARSLCSVKMSSWQAGILSVLGYVTVCALPLSVLSYVTIPANDRWSRRACGRVRCVT